MAGDADVGDRIERLENQVRWQRRFMGILALALASVVVMGQTRPLQEKVEAREFVVVNEDGVEVGRLGVASDGGGEMDLQTGDSLPSSMMEITASRVHVSRYEGNEPYYSSTTSLHANGVFHRRHGDRGPADRIYIGAGSNGPILAISDGQGERRVTIGSTELFHPRTGSTEIRAPASIVLFDPEGDVIWSAP